MSESDALKIAANLPDNRRYCRPWTRDFLEDFSQAFYNEFHQPIQVNSLVRTVEQQHSLRRHNRFAAPEFGDTASTHLTGVTADLSRRGFTKAQYAWVRAYLMPLHEAGLVDPIEESQPVLHIVVYDKYSAHNTTNEISLSEASEPGEFPLERSRSEASDSARKYVPIASPVQLLCRYLSPVARRDSSFAPFSAHSGNYPEHLRSIEQNFHG